mmetsp:Transcript_25853/g.77195  ORF Transcript_25853/g.77195 Transcript_25853/m.77195 type:complete len:276 (+) Transcript_25853:1844-2671(+)
MIQGYWFTETDCCAAHNSQCHTRETRPRLSTPRNPLCSGTLPSLSAPREPVQPRLGRRRPLFALPPRDGRRVGRLKLERGEPLARPLELGAVAAHALRLLDGGGESGQIGARRRLDEEGGSGGTLRLLLLAPLLARLLRLLLLLPRLCALALLPVRLLLLRQALGHVRGSPIPPLGQLRASLAEGAAHLARLCHVVRHAEAVPHVAEGRVGAPLEQHLHAPGVARLGRLVQLGREIGCLRLCARQLRLRLRLRRHPPLLPQLARGGRRGRLRLTL